MTEDWSWSFLSSYKEKGPVDALFGSRCAVDILFEQGLILATPNSYKAPKQLPSAIIQS